MEKKSNGGKQCNSSDLGRRFHASALTQAPHLSLCAAEQIVPNIVAGWLSDAGIPFKDENLVNSCPSAKTLDSVVLDATVDSMIWLEKQLEDTDAIFISCDKGHRKGVDHFQKVLSWWSKKENKAMCCAIDVDGAGSNSQKSVLKQFGTH